MDEVRGANVQAAPAPDGAASGAPCLPVSLSVDPVFAALQFLTIVPPVVRRAFSADELGRAVGWFAAVGVLLGGGLAAADYGLSFLLPPGVTAALVLAMWVIGTGALHLDGWLDTCDGLFGGHTPEARLRIMRDERAGAFAVIGGGLLLLVKYACLAALTDRAALVVAPALGRGAMAVAVVAFPYARAEGLGRSMKDHAGVAQALFAGVTALATAGLVGGGPGLAGVALAALATLAGAGLARRRLGGFTGDLYGALCEVVEALTLLAFVAGGPP